MDLVQHCQSICQERCFQKGNTYTSANVSHNTVNRLLTNGSSQCLFPAQTAHCIDSLMSGPVGLGRQLFQKRDKESHDAFVVE